MNYRTRILSSLTEIGQQQWDQLVRMHPDATPFLSYAFLHALHESGSAGAQTGWQPQYLTLWGSDGKQELLQAALPLYVKSHSYGEYVFDWAWADAYRRNGLEYYPKLLSAIPFTPVAGPRLLARDPAARAALLATLCDLQQVNGLSSTHILLPTEGEAAQLEQAGFIMRTSVQFHWLNRGYRDFQDFLDALERKKRKNIRAERRHVREAGVQFRRVPGTAASNEDWRFFKRCYDRTYAAHYSTPYLNLDFFQRIGATMPENLLLVIAVRDGLPIASALLVHDDKALYGRYWGALEHIPCLHFETAYYQPLEFCIARGIARFEGGAQGEHKMARGFLPHALHSAHWLAHPGFADAVQVFTEREGQDLGHYLDELNERNPYHPDVENRE